MTTEMQEIAITEEKPLLPGQSDAVKHTVLRLLCWYLTKCALKDVFNLFYHLLHCQLL
uniref:Uncharacterized protein n=1 Tax=Sinocyclocheilus grahami TaxID=75366 RepID=A0A672KBD1_SINGR